MKNPWEEILTPLQDFNVRRVSENHPLALYWAKDISGAYLFVIEFSKEIIPNKKSLPELSGIKIAVTQTLKCGRMVLLLNETVNWGIFKSLCIDLIHATADAKTHADALQVLMMRLLRWHEFLKRNIQKQLSREEILGLIGELLFMRDVLAPSFGWDNTISFWKGPLGAPQDFAVFDTAIEIKTQSGVSKPYIQINSLSQLDSKLPKLYLATNILIKGEVKHENVFTLNSLIKDIRTRLNDVQHMTRELFESLIFQIGYQELDVYDDLCFRCIGWRYFRVSDEFPRITLADVPFGIVKASYQISLESCTPFESSLNFENIGE